MFTFYNNACKIGLDAFVTLWLSSSGPLKINEKIVTDFILEQFIVVRDGFYDFCQPQTPTQLKSIYSTQRNSKKKLGARKIFVKKFGSKNFRSKEILVMGPKKMFGPNFFLDPVNIVYCLQI